MSLPYQQYALIHVLPIPTTMIDSAQKQVAVEKVAVEKVAVEKVDIAGEVGLYIAVEALPVVNHRIRWVQQGVQEADRRIAKEAKD
jgi:hypothetical protein